MTEQLQWVETLVLDIAHLLSTLPEEAKVIITGVQEPAEAWRLLEERYGDAKIAVLSAIHKLLTVKFPDGPQYIFPQPTGRIPL